MNTINIILILIAITVAGVILGFVGAKYPSLGKVIFEERNIGELIYIILYLAALFGIIFTKHKIKPKWGSLIASFLLPGLGQVLYAKQWLKMIILLVLIIVGPIFSLIIFAFSKTIGISLMLFIIVALFYNLIDAYKVGKRVEGK